MRGTRRGSRPLPEQSLPILLLAANDLGFRAIIRETELAARSAGGNRRDSAPPQRGHREQGTVEGAILRGDRATVIIERIWCEKIRGCSYGGRGACFPATPDAERVPQGDEMRKNHTPWCRQAVKVGSVYLLR
jgi:hypothetical protein